MSIPLESGPDPAWGARRPTEHQLKLAGVRARTTGESVAHVLSVFMGAGRYGERAAADGPEVVLAGAASETSGPPGPAAPAGRDTGGPEEIADVIPLSRVRRPRGGDGTAAR